MLVPFALWWAWTMGHSVPRSDDLAYLEWAARSSSVADVWGSPPPFPGRRPLNALAWWAGFRVSGNPAVSVAAFEAGLWLLGLLTWAGWAHRRGGPPAAAWTVALLLATPLYRDLPTWRSWMTSTGACAFAGGALWALEARRPWLAVCLALCGLAFKESAAAVVVGAAALVWRQWAVAAIVALAVLPGVNVFASSPHPYLPADLVAHAAFYARQVGGSVWLPAASWGAVGAPLAAAAPLGQVAPLLAGVATVVLGVAQGWRSPWTWVVAGTCVLPLLYRTENPYYLLEGTLVVAVLFATALGRRRIPWWVGAFALAPAGWSWAASWENAAWQRGQWELAERVWAAEEGRPAGELHITADAPDGARFVAFRLVRERGWREVAEAQGRELAFGVTTRP